MSNQRPNPWDYLESDTPNAGETDQTSGGECTSTQYWDDQGHPVIVSDPDPNQGSFHLSTHQPELHSQGGAYCTASVPDLTASGQYTQMPFDNPSGSAVAQVRGQHNYQFSAQPSASPVTMAPYGGYPAQHTIFPSEHQQSFVPGMQPTLGDRSYDYPSPMDNNRGPIQVDAQLGSIVAPQCYLGGAPGQFDYSHQAQDTSGQVNPIYPHFSGQDDHTVTLERIRLEPLMKEATSRGLSFTKEAAAHMLSGPSNISSSQGLPKTGKM
nr:uncharacterized protein CI109_006283 [Kwoniella shandongensis]KAA5525384.1 hypothetical protein CI109_006283 [Kwoniella shandongensis]